MKYLSILLIALSFCLTACNNNDEPPIEVNLPITTQYLPTGVIFENSDKEFRAKIKPFVNTKWIVNSVDELPNDPLGFSENYYKIGFSNHTLLLFYDIDIYNLVSYQNRYFRNTVENTYNWSILFGISGKLNEDDSNIEKLFFARYALLVPKLPDNADVKIQTSIIDHNWDWDK